VFTCNFLSSHPSTYWCLLKKLFLQKHFFISEVNLFQKLHNAINFSSIKETHDIRYCGTAVHEIYRKPVNITDTTVNRTCQSLLYSSLLILPSKAFRAPTTSTCRMKNNNNEFIQRNRQCWMAYENIHEIFTIFTVFLSIKILLLSNYSSDMFTLYMYCLIIQIVEHVLYLNQRF